MWGLGSVTRARLAEIGVHTIGLLAKMPECSLEGLLAASTAISPIRTAERDRGWLGRAMRVESARSGRPLWVRAQQATPVIGFFSPASPEDLTDRLRAFRQGLGAKG